MKNNYLLFGILVLCFFISSCSVKLDDYTDESTQFDISSYFDGQILAWGTIQDRTGKVTRTFCVEIEGNWAGNSGLLAETFYFNDGEITYRNWKLTKTPNGQYLGEAEDVEGIAIGKHSGLAFHMEYQLNVPYDGENYLMTMDDWMFQIDANKVINKTTMSKYGVKFADITLAFDKDSKNAKCNMSQ